MVVGRLFPEGVGIGKGIRPGEGGRDVRVGVCWFWGLRSNIGYNLGEWIA